MERRLTQLSMTYTRDLQALLYNAQLAAVHTRIDKLTNKEGNDMCCICTLLLLNDCT